MHDEWIKHYSEMSLRTCVIFFDPWIPGSGSRQNRGGRDWMITSMIFSGIL